MKKNIGIDAKPPERVCSDPKCCWHGKLPIRGKVIEGIVVSAKAQKTAIVKREYFHYIPKYERYERRHSRIAAYNPECISAKEGDRVRIAECRPISKTKAFTVIEVIERKR
ncbi:MAG: 30S ribosomal protein S17 [Candidatus Aenigmarchaeota archaeon]|nr:30S ribosomal protein S17 [Candidatus Aenigmarchaeota archaeon]